MAAAEGAEACPGPRHADRPHELPPVPAAALPGRGRHPRAGHDHDADSRDVPRPAERRRAHGRGDRRRQGATDWSSSTATRPPIPYDYLVLATGVSAATSATTSGRRWAPSMKTLADAEFLRRRIVGALEQADLEPTTRGPPAAADVRAGRRGTDRLRAGWRAGRALPPAAARVPPHRSARMRASSWSRPGRERWPRSTSRCRPAPWPSCVAWAWRCALGQAVEHVDAEGVDHRRRTRPDANGALDRGCGGVARRPLAGRRDRSAGSGRSSGQT